MRNSYFSIKRPPFCLKGWSLRLEVEVLGEGGSQAVPLWGAQLRRAVTAPVCLANASLPVLQGEGVRVLGESRRPWE